MYKNILLARIQGAAKTVKFVEVVPKTGGSATICAHRNAILSSEILKKWEHCIGEYL